MDPEDQDPKIQSISGQHFRKVNRTHPTSIRSGVRKLHIMETISIKLVKAHLGALRNNGGVRGSACDDQGSEQDQELHDER